MLVYEWQLIFNSYSILIHFNIIMCIVHVASQILCQILMYVINIAKTLLIEYTV